MHTDGEGKGDFGHADGGREYFARTDGGRGDGREHGDEREGLNGVIVKANGMCKGVPLWNSITSFAGVRAYSDRHDFVIEESKKVKGLIHCIGIESPGLTSAPAIAKYVTEELLGKNFTLKANPKFNGRRKPIISSRIFPRKRKTR